MDSEQSDMAGVNRTLALTVCPVDERPKLPGSYLCRGCKATMKPTARHALDKRDNDRPARLLSLHQQITNGIHLMRVDLR